MKEPDDFPRSYFDGGRHLSSEGRGPCLADLLNVVSRAFFDGILRVKVDQHRVELQFRATCPFDEQPLRGRYPGILSLHNLLGGTPLSEPRGLLFTETILGTIVKTEKNWIQFYTDLDGLFSCAASLSEPGDYLAMISGCSLPLDCLMFVNRTALLRPILSGPITVSNAHARLGEDPSS